jgi:hypothetical protein
MAKLKLSPIAATDLGDFVTRNSDFGFEMRVLTRLGAEGFSCLHSGTYSDPVTGKIRQFDVRASANRGNSTLSLAVECKNLRPNNPLLLSAVPRTPAEAFHDLLVYHPEVIYPMFTVQPLTGQASVYKPVDMVAKKTDQVGRDTSGELISNDEATFEKLNQAVNSCQDLVRTLSIRTSSPNRRVIVPVLVVPTGLLWQVDYGPDGTITTPPRQVKRAALFLDHTWPAHLLDGGSISYRLSHIEVVTFEALTGIAERWLGPDGFFPQ